MHPASTHHGVRSAALYSAALGPTATFHHARQSFEVVVVDDGRERAKLHAACSAQSAFYLRTVSGGAYVSGLVLDSMVLDMERFVAAGIGRWSDPHKRAVLPPPGFVAPMDARDAIVAAACIVGAGKMLHPTCRTDTCNPPLFSVAAVHFLDHVKERYPHCGADVGQAERFLAAFAAFLVADRDAKATGDFGEIAALRRRIAQLERQVGACDHSAVSDSRSPVSTVATAPPGCPSECTPFGQWQKRSRSADDEDCVRPASPCEAFV